MAGDEETYKLNDFIVGNDKLNQSNLNTFYQSYFETECDDSKISNSYCYQDIKFGTLPTALSELYRKFERNLILIWDDEENVYENWETDKKKICSYLKYWIYDHSGMSIREKITRNMNAFSKFINLWNEQKEEKCPSCECEFKIKSFSLVKHLKKAYDYFLFLNAYNDTKTISTHIADKNYCKYIDGSKTVYSLYPLICKGGITENCKEFEKYILPYMKNDDENSILCESESTYEPDEEDYQKAQGIPKKLAAIKEKDQEYNAQLAKAEEDDVPVPEATRDDTARAQSQYDRVVSPRLGDRGSGHVLTNNLPGSEGFMPSPDLNTDIQGNGNPIKTITSASLVGVPSIIFLLYKFSPVRTWLDPRIRKTKSDLRNSIQGSNELQSHDYNFDTTNMDFNRFNVGYQSR
ncbi:PIR protein [Plasmodium vivax]|uniref:VIR protein n=1 Tax=Plasmodium vivax TaxID=5855 RepID=A0A565A760_PLAVI|nr:PIR protein [Plasmodium vivax]